MLPEALQKATMERLFMALRRSNRGFWSSLNTGLIIMRMRLLLPAIVSMLAASLPKQMDKRTPHWRSGIIQLKNGIPIGAAGFNGESMHSLRMAKAEFMQVVNLGGCGS